MTVLIAVLAILECSVLLISETEPQASKLLVLFCYPRSNWTAATMGSVEKPSCSPQCSPKSETFKVIKTKLNPTQKPTPCQNISPIYNKKITHPAAGWKVWRKLDLTSIRGTNSCVKPNPTELMIW